MRSIATGLREVEAEAAAGQDAVNLLPNLRLNQSQSQSLLPPSHMLSLSHKQRLEPEAGAEAEAGQGNDSKMTNVRHKSLWTNQSLSPLLMRPGAAAEAAAEAVRQTCLLSLLKKQQPHSQPLLCYPATQTGRRQQWKDHPPSAAV